MPELRDIPGYEGMYAVSDSGRVYALRRTIQQSNGCSRVQKRKRLKAWLNKTRNMEYWRVSLCRDGIKSYQYVHKLVCLAFHGEPPAGEIEVRHLDGNSNNNRAENLAWGTHAENEADKYRYAEVPF